MAHDDNDPPDDDFLRAMDGVERLEKRPEGPRRRKRAERRVSAAHEKNYSFETEVFGEQVEGLLRGTDRKELRRLRTGEISPEAEIDLHGYGEGAARRAVVAHVRESFEAGIRCLLIIHGRGLHHEGGGVLRRAIPQWLVEPTLAPLVLAFVTAPREHGGPGALLVYLRRNRARR